MLDSCDISGEESKKHEVYESPDIAESEDEGVSDDLLSHPSIRVNARVKPDNTFLKDNTRDPYKIQNNKHTLNNLENHNMDGRVIIREIGNGPKNSDMLTGETMSSSKINKVQQGLKKVSPETNPRPDYDFPLSKNQFMQVIDSVERYESNMRNSQEDFLENRPVYYHSTTPSLRDRPYSPERRGNEEMKIDNKNIGPLSMAPPNQKPMTLQTFMRPQGKPIMSNNIFFRRPTAGEMRIRRPGMPKPILGMPPKLPPPPPFMIGQAPFMNPPKKPFYKMPVMNRPPMNIPNRPPVVMPVKQFPNGNTPKPQFIMNHNQNQNQNTLKNPTQSVIMGKPNLMSQTLTLGQPTIIGQQIVRSQMTLPSSSGDNFPQQSIVNSYLNKPGQIIMGKPMDNPLPLDQQMIQTNQHINFATVNLPNNVIELPALNNPKFEVVKPVYEVETTSRSNYIAANITPSEFINSSPNPNEILVTMKPAVNTGFKPDSVVIEGGFKPIIREPLLSGQDRITDYDSDSVTNNRRQDIDSKESAEEEPVNRVVKDNFYEKQLTESFEPMFIPSPPDRHLQGKNVTTSNEKLKLFEYLNMRPHPVYIKPPEVDINTSDSSEIEKDGKSSDDMAMAADRIDAFYLPPDRKNPNIDLPPGTVVSYDGHTLSDPSLTNPVLKNSGNKIYSAKLSNSELLTKTPQFGPFKGEIPSLIQSQLSSGQVTKLQAVTNSHSLPGSLIGKKGEKIVHTISATSEEDDDEDKSILDDIEYDASERDDVIAEADDEDESAEEKSDINRERREADHIHNGSTIEENLNSENHQHDHSHHDHSQHNHSHHDHSQHEQLNNNRTIIKSSATKLSHYSLLYFLPLVIRVLYV